MIQRKRSYSKIRYYSIPLLFLLSTALLLVFSGCQEESEEITLPSDNVILFNSSIANYIQRISLHDGSPDNIVDNSSCITIQLPVTVVANGQLIEIESRSDLTTVERIFDEFEDDDDTIQIIFPVTVTLLDHRVLIINNSEELEDIADACTEGGQDDDIECLDFQYPLTFTFYHSDNKLSDVITMHDDQDLFEFFDTLEDSELVSFRFPVTVITSEGEEIIVNNNDQLVDIIEDVMDACDEDDDNDHNDDDADDSAFIAVLTDGIWKITYFFDEANKTEALAGFTFIFNADSTALATNDTSSFNGTWETYGDSGFIELEFYFEGETPLNEIQEDWTIHEFTESVIKLTYIDEEDGSESNLHFQKN